MTKLQFSYAILPYRCLCVSQLTKIEYFNYSNEYKNGMTEEKSRFKY